MASLIYLFLCFVVIEGTSCLELSLADQQEISEIVIRPKSLREVPEGTLQSVKWSTTYPGAVHTSIEVSNTNVGNIIFYEESFYEASLNKNETGKGSFNITSDSIGINYISLTIYDKDDNILGSTKIGMTVIIAYEKANKIFYFILTGLVFISYISMGAALDLRKLIGIIRNPACPLLGIICQYGFIPLVAFFLSKLYFREDELRQLGMFLLGISPGSELSNMWTLLLGGSLDLSILMSLVSSIVAFGALPMWVLTLGPAILSEESSFHIPYDYLFYSIVLLIVPCSVGLFIRIFIPKLAEFLQNWMMKTVALFTICYVFPLGFYSYRYMFQMLTWKIILASFTLSASGYLFGFSAAFLAKRSWKEIIAISIETGLLNTYIPITILNYTVGKPMEVLAVVIPISATFITPILLFMAFIIKQLYQYYDHSGGRADAKPVVVKTQLLHQEIQQIYTIPLPDSLFRGPNSNNYSAIGFSGK